MIKLFWNTHNQKKSISNDKKIREKEELDYGWGKYHKRSSDKWIYEVLQKVKYNIIENETNLEKDDTLIIIDSSVEAKIEFYRKLNLTCKKIFLFHLGDEFGFHNLSEIYEVCNYIWRPFCSSKYFNNQKVKCIPIGYKSGVALEEKRIRKYKWAFTGTSHKSSRQDLLFQFSDIEPFYCHKTKKFDVQIISTEEMNSVLSSTEFIPCPNGFFHPETYRVYEALECESIPIVESAYNYYDRLFPGNPFIKVEKWIDAKPIVKGWSGDQIGKKRDECREWWSKQKNNIQDSIKNEISL